MTTSQACHADSWPGHPTQQQHKSGSGRRPTHRQHGQNGAFTGPTLPAQDNPSPALITAGREIPGHRTRTAHAAFRKWLKAGVIEDGKWSQTRRRLERGQDAADRVRAARRPAAEGTRPGQSGDVRFPGLHAHLREDQGRAVRAAAGHDLQADAGQAARGQERAHAAAASARLRAGQMAGKRGARALRLLCRARQQQGGQGIPGPGGQALAPGAAAPQPADPPELGTHGPSRHPVASPGPDHAPLAERAVRRPHPKQEPSALAAHAGICAGGGPPIRAVPTATASFCGSPGVRFRVPRTKEAVVR